MKRIITISTVCFLWLNTAVVHAGSLYAHKSYVIEVTAGEVEETESVEDNTLQNSNIEN